MANTQDGFGQFHPRDMTNLKPLLTGHQPLRGQKPSQQNGGEACGLENYSLLAAADCKRATLCLWKKSISRAQSEQPICFFASFFPPLYSTGCTLRQLVLLSGRIGGTAHDNSNMPLTVFSNLRKDKPWSRSFILAAYLHIEQAQILFLAVMHTSIVKYEPLQGLCTFQASRSCLDLLRLDLHTS